MAVEKGDETSKQIKSLTNSIVKAELNDKTYKFSIIIVFIFIN